MKTTKLFALLSILFASVIAFAGTSTVSLAKEGAKQASAKKVVAKKAVVKKTRVSKKALYIKIQKALNEQGAAIKADGKWGRKSRAALKMYQKKNGLKATGRINKATKAKLLGAA